MWKIGTFEHYCDNCDDKQANLLRNQSRSKSIIEVHACEDLFNDSYGHICKPYIWKQQWICDSCITICDFSISNWINQLHLAVMMNN